MAGRSSKGKDRAEDAVNCVGNRKRALIKTIKILVCLAALLVVFFTAAAATVYIYGSRRVVSAEDAASFNADCILVLGCGVRPDKTPSLMLADRLDRAIELYKSGACGKLLMSGDHSEEYYDEVNVMKNYAIAAGVPSGDIFMDHAGLSTYDSMYRAKAIFQAERVIVVSQRYHIYRAVYIGERMGLSCAGAPARDVVYSGHRFRLAREAVAQVKDFVMCIFKPEPVFLGDPIPVWGDGDITNDA